MLGSDIMLADAGDLLWERGIRRLYLLQAQALTAQAWGALRQLAAPADVRLSLVLSGACPRFAQVRVLEGCRVRRGRVPVPSPAPRPPPCWSCPSHRAAPAATAPPRLIRPAARPEAAGVLAFRVAALGIVIDNRIEGRHRVIGLLPVATPTPTVGAGVISRARLAEAFRTVMRGATG